MTSSDPGVPGVPLPRGAVVGDFEIESPLGAGGMGRVYRARQRGVDRSVALKILSSRYADDPAFTERFRREASTMRDLDHPAILTVYAAGEENGTFYLATRLVDGPDLGRLLTSRGRLPHTEVLDLLRQVADGLDHAHARGVVHRDVKPENILVDHRGRAFLADFGISKQLGTPGLTSAGQYVGTPRYMAPEQAESGAGGHRADIYSLGCVAFEMLTGAPPYTDADTIPMITAHATKPVPRASTSDPSLPQAVDDVLACALAKEPGHRFDSAGGFVTALGAAMAGGTPRLPAAPRPSTRRRWRPAVLVSAAAATALALTAGTLVGTSMGPDAPSAPPASGDADAYDAPRDIGPVPLVPAPAELSAVRRGPLLYEAGMNGTPDGFVVAPATEADSARESIRYGAAGLELEIHVAGGETYSELAVDDGLTTYVGEMDLLVRPGSEVELCWSLRWAVPRQLANYWCVDTRTQQATFSVYRRSTGRAKHPLGPSVPVPGLQDGRTVRVALVVRERQLSMYLDGALVVDTPNDEVPVAGTLPGIELQGPRGTGMVTVQRLRVYDLAPIT